MLGMLIFSLYRLIAARAGRGRYGVSWKGACRWWMAWTARLLPGGVLMQLGSAEKAVTEAVKEVIRILKKMQAASVPQVCFTFSCHPGGKRVT